jgi:hypothetical protein
MKTFIQWASEEKKELPLYTTDENTKRAGIAHWAYPPAYSGREYAYPDGYFLPHAADALFKLGKTGKKD